MNGMWLSKAQRDYLDSDRIKAQREQRIFEQQATPEFAANMATFETLYPTASAELGLGATVAHIPATDPMMEEIVQIEQTERVTNGPLTTPGGGIWDGLARTLDEFVYDPIKGATSWGMMGLMAVYEIGPGGSLIRSAEQSRQDPDTSFGEAFQEQQPFLTDAGYQAFGGLNRTWETIKSAWQESTTKDEEQQAMMEAGDMQFTSNTGGGWFVNSDVAPDVKESVELATMEMHRSLDGQNLTPNQRYRAELEASPEIWNKAVANATAYQGGLGAPMTQQGYANRESVMFQVPNFTGPEDRFTPWSPGRIAAATVFEPGTGSFAVASGIGDVASQIWLDPMNKIGKLWSASGKWGRSIWAGATETNNNVNRAFGEGFQMANRNYVQTRQPVRQGAIPGQVFHGGHQQVAEAGLKSGGITHDLRRAAGYAETRGGEQGAVHVFDQTDLPQDVRKATQRGDLEQFRHGDYTQKDLDLFDEIEEELADTLAEIRDDYRYIAQQEHDIGKMTSMDPDNLAALKAGHADDTESILKDMDSSLRWRMEKDGYTEDEIQKAIQYVQETKGGVGMGPMGLYGPDRPMPFDAMSPEQARKLADEGAIPYVPDESIDMMENFKLRTESTIAKRDPDAWKTGETPLGPFDPPEFYADASRAAARQFDQLDSRIVILDGNLVETGRPIREFPRTGEPFGEATGRGAEGVLAHGGETLDPRKPFEGGLSHDIGRGIGYAEGRIPEGRGRVSFFEQSELPGPLREAAEKGDIEQVVAKAGIPPERADEFVGLFDEIKPLMDEHEALNKAYDKGLDEFDIVDPNDPVFLKYQNEFYDKLEASEKRISDLRKKKMAEWDEATKAAFDDFAYRDPGQVVSVESPTPFATMTVAEARKALGEGRLPFKPGSDEYEAVKKIAGRKSKKAKMFGKTEKQFLDDYEDFYLPEGTVDEMSTAADNTNRLGQQPVLRVVTKDKAAGTNQKVRVFGSTIDLSGTSLEKIPPKVKRVLQSTGLWDNTIGFRGSGSNTNWHHSLLNAMREDGVGRLKLPDGGWLVVDDFIGGSKADNMGSRIFYADGAKPIHPSDLASSSRVTPDEVNTILDNIMDIAKHAINPDGTIDGTKLSREALEQLKKDNPELFAKLDDAIANGKTPTQTVPGNRPTLDPDQGYELFGKHRDTLVKDLYEMSRGEGGAGNVDRFLRKLEKKGVPIPLHVRQGIMDAKTPEEVRSVLAAWIATGPGKITLPGGTGYGRMRGMLGVIDSITGSALQGKSMRGVGPVGRFFEQSWAQRQMAMMLPSEGVNMVDDPAAAYSLMDQMLINYGVARGGADVESVFTRLRNLDVGNRREAYSIMRDYEAILFGHLVETTDVPEAYIKAVTQFIDDNGVMHIYNAERIGMTALGGATGDMARLSGEAVHMPGMSLTTEMWNGAMHVPNPTEVKRVTAYQNKIGEIANFITSKRVKLNKDLDWDKVGRKEWKKQAEDDAKRLSARQAKEDKDKPLNVLIQEMKDSTQRVEIQDRAGYYLARSAMNKIWKPLVLLRGAWTLRILMDDQMRVAAEGMSMFNHPLRMITYAMQQPKAWKEAFTKGFVDINGARVTLKNIDTVHHGLMYQRAMMAVPDGVVGRGAYGSRYARVIKRGKPGYEEGLTSRLAQFGGDGLGRRLAGSKADDADTTVANAVEWLSGDFGDARVMGKTGPEQLRDIIALKADDADLVARLEAAAAGGDRTVVEMLVREVNAEMHHTAGGVVILEHKGSYLRYDESLQDITEEVIEKYNLPRPKQQTDQARPIILEKGNEDIMEVLSTGGWKDPKAVDLPKGDRGKGFNLTARNNTLTDEGYKKFRRMVTDKVQESIDSDEATRFLTQSYGPDLDSFGGADAVKDSANRAIGFFYEWMMTKPSDRLSRSPLFAARYWRSMGERMPFLDDAGRALVRKKAIKAGKLHEMDTAFKRTSKMLGKTDAAKANGTLTGKASEIINVLDEHAKAAGLAEVEATLFNLTQKRNISDSLNLIFPFVEAWGEFASRWGRLMVYGDNNIKNANRLQQGVNSLRESDPFSPTGDQGFFHENEFGQEVFSYPAFITKGQIGLWNMLAAVTPLTGISPEAADSIKATGSVESLNFASGILPGFGPIFQMASKAALSDDPRWDGIKEIISPFGTGGGAVSQFAPGWIKRMVSAMGSEDPQLNALWMSTVQDVVRTKIDNGDFNGVTDQQQIQAIVAEAESEAKNILMVRAANTFWAPSSPSYKFTKEDKTGKVHTYSELGQEYRNILYDEAGGNETTAFGIFYERYGSLPESFTASKTYTVKPGPVTTEGYKFQRDNPEFFDAYPSTAMFLMPDVDLETHEFNYERYLERLRLSESEQWTGEQLVSLRDDLLGGMEWDHAMQTIQYLKDGGDTETYNTQQARLRIEIQERHPYWGQRGAPGQRIGVSNDAKMVEIEAWTQDPNLRGVPIVEAVRRYIAQRDDVLATLEAEYSLKTLDGSMKKHAVQARTYLRGVADGLSGQYPEFAYLFDRIYSREIGVEHDGYSPENVDFYGEDFFEATMGMSPTTLPKFENKYLGASV